MLTAEVVVERLDVGIHADGQALRSIFRLVQPSAMMYKFCRTETIKSNNQVAMIPVQEAAS